MRIDTIKTEVYQFSELSEKAKENAIEKLYDINIEFDWWDSVYEDAENIGLKITSFDTDRGSYCTLENKDGWSFVADKILSEHGKKCESYQLSKEFLKNRDSLVCKYKGDNENSVSYENEYDFDNECDELEGEFKKALQEEYLSILRCQYEYLTSKEAIIETIEANKYEFTKEGVLY